MNATEVGTAFFTTPGVPADRLTALRRAFDAAMKDPDLLAEAEKIKVGVSPMAGEELQKLVAEVSNLSPALLEKVRAAYTTTKANYNSDIPHPTGHELLATCEPACVGLGRLARIRSRKPEIGGEPGRCHMDQAATSEAVHPEARAHHASGIAVV